MWSLWSTLKIFVSTTDKMPSTEFNNGQMYLIKPKMTDQPINFPHILGKSHLALNMIINGKT